MSKSDLKAEDLNHPVSEPTGDDGAEQIALLEKANAELAAENANLRRAAEAERDRAVKAEVANAELRKNLDQARTTSPAGRPPGTIRVHWKTGGWSDYPAATLTHWQHRQKTRPNGKILKVEK